eukprot:5494967-Alexandrium_andersonii.AAC.1
MDHAVKHTMHSCVTASNGRALMDCQTKYGVNGTVICNLHKELPAQLMICSDVHSRNAITIKRCDGGASRGR